MSTSFYRVDETTIDNLLARRTVRKFTSEPVGDETIERLLQVVNRTATAVGMQHFSVIRVKDRKIREQLADVAGQDYVASSPELWVFLVDTYRNRKIAELNGAEAVSADTMNAFFQGYADALLAAQTLAAAVEALGMGTVFFGSILNDAERTCEILSLPKLTFPVLGVGFGVPAESPAQKPRLPLSMKFFTDRYDGLTIDRGLLTAYDEEMAAYCDLRDKSRNVDSFSKQVVTFLNMQNEKRANMLDVVEQQGFRLNLR